MSKILQENMLNLLFCALLSALMLSLGIPNELFLFGSALFGIFALAPLYMALARARSFAAAGVTCGAQIACVHLFSSFWLANFKDFAIFTLGASTIAYFGLGVLIGWCLKAVMGSREDIRPFAFAACWVCWEWLKGTGFLGYPWGTLPLASLGLRRLVQIADTTGIWGISFLLALCSSATAEIIFFLLYKKINVLTLRGAFSHPAVRAALFAIALFALSFFYGLCRINALPAPEGSFAASIVQQNSDPWGSGGGAEETLRNIQSLTRSALQSWKDEGKEPDIIIWSESSLSSPFNTAQGRLYYRARPKGGTFFSFLEEAGTPIFTGSPFVADENGRRRHYNAAILIAPDGEIADWYGKIQLVPFAEYVPFSDNEFLAGLFEKIVGFSSGWTPGKKLTVFSFEAKTPDGGALQVPFTSPICFEDAFPAVTARLHRAGGKVLINITNDSWSRTASAEYQHFAVASFRVIELRCTMIRSTNGGYTVIILPTGEVAASLPLFEKAYLNAHVPVYPREETFYLKFGDWLAFLCAVFAACAVINALKLKKPKN